MAANNNTPTTLACVIASEASSGDVNEIPVDPIAYSARASQKTGFPHLTMISLGEGGEAPFGEDFNGFWSLLSSHNFFMQNGGCYTFNPDVSEAIGGYAKNQILWYFPENGYPVPVVSMINNNTNNFVDDPTLIDGAKWSYFLANKDIPVVSIPATSGTVTLKDNTVYTGTMTGNMTFSLPSVTDTTIYHQIKAMLYLPVVTINWGTSHYIGGYTQSVTTAGQYMIYWDYVPNLSSWAVGIMKVS